MLSSALQKSTTLSLCLLLLSVAPVRVLSQLPPVHPQAPPPDDRFKADI
jgi:hypothetical protein